MTNSQKQEETKLLEYPKPINKLKPRNLVASTNNKLKLVFNNNLHLSLQASSILQQIEDTINKLKVHKLGAPTSNKLKKDLTGLLGLNSTLKALNIVQQTKVTIHNLGVPTTNRLKKDLTGLNSTLKALNIVQQTEVTISKLKVHNLEASSNNLFRQDLTVVLGNLDLSLKVSNILQLTEDTCHLVPNSLEVSPMVTAMGNRLKYQQEQQVTRVELMVAMQLLDHLLRWVTSTVT